MITYEKVRKRGINMVTKGKIRKSGLGRGQVIVTEGKVRKKCPSHEKKLGNVGPRWLPAAHGGSLWPTTVLGGQCVGKKIDLGKKIHTGVWEMAQGYGKSGTCARPPRPPTCTRLMHPGRAHVPWCTKITKLQPRTSIFENFLALKGFLWPKLDGLCVGRKKN